MSLYRRGEVWWIDLTHAGRRIRRSSRTRDRGRAQRVHDELKARLWRLRPGGRTLHGALEAWRAAGVHHSADLDRLNKFTRLYADRPLAMVTAESLAAAIPASSPATFNRYANLITAALNLARRRGWIEEVPRIERRRTAPHRLRWLTPEEWIRLRAALPEHLRPLAEFALATGLRQKNVTHLEWSQVDLRRRVAWIHADQAKGRRAIGIPLSAAACAILARQRGRHDTWIFPYRGRPLGKIKTAWQSALARAEIENFTWHDLRHTWASWHVQAGTPLAVLRELGGWRSIAMVARYAHLAPEHLRPYVARVSGLLAGPGHVSGHSRHNASAQRKKRA